jgi:hypothetical protein
MCCFSRPVESVTNTNLFARSAAEGRQFLVYEMTFSSKEDLAMILPIPVPMASPEDAVRFIDLKGCPDFFRRMKGGFPDPVALSAGRGRKAEAAPAAAPLKVVEAGDFEASFVPAVKDFARLDARFRLPEQTWEKLPAYKDFGFAVFKLKKGSKTVHPMAFEFPRADPKKLFFPTVHIHDGTIHPRAKFDHSLYCQSREGESLPLMTWRESHAPAARFMAMDQVQGLVDGERHCYLKTIRGDHPNEDAVL